MQGLTGLDNPCREGFLGTRYSLAEAHVVVVPYSRSFHTPSFMSSPSPLSHIPTLGSSETYVSQGLSHTSLRSKAHPVTSRDYSLE